MHLVYIDDSKDDKDICFSAIMIPVARWMDAFDHLIGMRRTMKASDGIYTRVELHATDWLGGRGRIAPFSVPKGARVRLFDYVLSSVVLLPGVDVFNAFGHKNDENRLFERLIQRIHNTVNRRGSHALIISDNGKNYDSLLRRMRRFNHVPSAYGGWETGAFTKNMPVDSVVEDLVYRDSKRSLFIQAADFCAFSLLRNEKPTVKAKAYGFDKSFSILDPCLFKAAFKADPRKLGIIRA